jgi:hypothetical protein
LDISYCGLRRDEVFEVVKACKRSRSLLGNEVYTDSLIAFHLTGNLLTDDTKTKIREYMMPRRRIKDLYDMIDD